MQIYLSTLTELDYDTSLDNIEESFNETPETSWQARKKVKYLRKSPLYNFELEVIAKNDNNEVVGHVLLIEVEIVSEIQTYYALAVASLSVKPDLRGQGLGSSLMSAVEERAKSQEYSTIIVRNNLEYFSKLGYDNAQDYDIQSEDHENILVKFLWDHLDNPPHGVIKIPQQLV
ncbi:N-acetyltransferase [Staphylococcus simiae]|uniref:GNAT family N-acetyltransferase n=1 Tax=Staphylococcus simiae TaxID=308354 RepID=UPI001A97A224|nr:N-acetyltransferase [Staphylococcus simiae]MBO1199737.1 N-acetyltransferase [Staphylococcus simiae]MBO1202035.1 N-acetyltransferase [Staphylococcus simiae]MBO1204280.1 N-acetyltransferase [Staphylococcus simiae]MBO1211794.1 N-acetyltransferase [Staphylococcus simiae]MBO1230467.1 N-acetyltransferase [Staphylococcus simiae]